MNTENIALPSEQLTGAERREMKREARQEIFRDLRADLRFARASSCKLRFLAKAKVDGMLRELRSF